ncbi:MAG: ABC transporter permease [Oscillospiraceae bacterium]|nr:ABC transporter permease [Oscillospiraceae bacterium]
MEAAIRTVFTMDFLVSSIRVTTPILLCALGVLVTNKAGIMNIGIEGMMLFAALFGVIGSAFTQSALVGLLCAIAASVLAGWIFAFFTLRLRSDILLTGLALSILAQGGTIFILYVITGDKSMSASLNSLQLPFITIPLIKDIPILGALLSGHNIIVYLSLICVVAMHMLMNKMPLGLRIRCVGENPATAGSVGIDVNMIKLKAITISGVLAGLAGAYLSMGYLPWFTGGMTAGRGFMGIAAQNLGNVVPLGTLIASFIFGMAEALANVFVLLHVPHEFVRMTPFVITIAGLIVVSIHRTRKERKRKLSLGKRQAADGNAE